jgi:hypothetical protein
VVGRGKGNTPGVTRTSFRILCVLALAVSIVIRFQVNRSREAAVAEFDASAAVSDVVRASGFAVLENPFKPPLLGAIAVYFRPPGCSRASVVLPYPLNAESLPLLSRLTGADFRLRFFYLGKSWNEQNRLGMYLEWFKYTVLGLFGASPYITVKKAIVLAEPPDCASAAAAADWAAVWSRQHGYAER